MALSLRRRRSSSCRPGFRQLLIERGVPESKIELIYNWCDEAALAAPDSMAPELAALNGQFRIVFAGNMGKAQSLDAVLEAADRLESRG